MVWATFLSPTLWVYIQPLWRNRPPKLPNCVK